MSAQIGDAASIDAESVHEAITRPIAHFNRDPISNDDRMTVARGVATAVLIAVPFWGLIALTVYLLV